MNLTKHAAVTDAGTSVTSPTGLAGLPQQLGDALRSALREPNQIRDRSIDRLAFAHDASHYSLIPLAVVVPRDAAEVGRPGGQRGPGSSADLPRRRHQPQRSEL